MRKLLFCKLLLPLACLLCTSLCHACKVDTCPLVWDIVRLKQMKSNISNSSEARSIIKVADKYSKIEPIIVTNKNLTFVKDSHYYCSVGPYWWPDQKNPGKYITQDGIVNPDSKLYDNGKLAELAKRCEYLSKAFYLTNDIKYYNLFLKQIEAWFINKETFMYPNFEYAQVVPNINNNKGRSTGFIGAYAFNSIIESLRLVQCIKKMDPVTIDKVRSWFREFAEWADKCSFGESLRKSNNNIGLAYDVTLVNLYLFVGGEKRAKEIVDNFAVTRINVQIKEDGSQPAELKRTKAFSYSLSNLTHILDFCNLVRYWYPNYYQDHHERIDAAFTFLSKYVNDESMFPYKQITSWKKCKKDYQKQLERLIHLRNED